MKKPNDIIPKEAFELAKQKGFDSVTFPEITKYWNGYKVYLPYFSYKKAFFGFPEYILEKKGELRYATEKEKEAITFSS